MRGVAKWQGRSLQKTHRRFDSDPRVHLIKKSQSCKVSPDYLSKT